MKTATALSDETIEGFKVQQLSLPVNSRRDHGIGTVEGSIRVVLLELTSSGGERGYGEASPWAVFTGTVEAAFAALDKYIRPWVVGRKLSDIRAIMTDSERCVAHCTEAKAALETALFDLAGRISGVPVSTLLGGRFRNRIPLSCSLANPDFKADLELLDRLVSDGIGIVKLKTGFQGHEFDLSRLEKLRSDYPGFDVRVDYNQGLHADDAIGRVRDVALFQPAFIEQPVESKLFGLMGRIRESIDVPLIADESVFNREDLLRAVSEGICDGISVKIMKSGGLLRSQQLAAMAGAAGLSAYGGDMFETGVAHLAGAHMVAASPEIILGCEFYQSRYYLVEDILEEEIPIIEGCIAVPDGPGLGIRPDLGKVEKFKVCESDGQGK